MSGCDQSAHNRLITSCESADVPVVLMTESVIVLQNRDPCFAGVKVGEKRDVSLSGSEWMGISVPDANHKIQSRLFVSLCLCGCVCV